MVGVVVGVGVAVDVGLAKAVSVARICMASSYVMRLSKLARVAFTNSDQLDGVPSVDPPQPTNMRTAAKTAAKNLRLPMSEKAFLHKRYVARSDLKNALPHQCISKTPNLWLKCAPLRGPSRASRYYLARAVNPSRPI